MLNRIRQLRQRRKKLKAFEQMKHYAELPDDSLYDDEFMIEVRNPQLADDRKKYVHIGHGSIVNCKIIFEERPGFVSIGNRSYIGGATIISRNSVEIGDDVIIAWDCMIYDHNSHSLYWEERKEDIQNTYKGMLEGNPLLNKKWEVVRSAPIKICNKVWIGFGVTILKGVTIGEGAVIGARSVVTKDIPPWTVWGGNPARKIKNL